MPAPSRIKLTDSDRLYRGADYILEFTMTNPPQGGVSGWQTQLTLRADNGKAPDPPALTSSGTVVDATLGIFEVPMTRAQTLALYARTYAASFDRVDVGASDPMAHGYVEFGEGVRDAPHA